MISLGVIMKLSVIAETHLLRSRHLDPGREVEKSVARLPIFAEDGSISSLEVTAWYFAHRRLILKSFTGWNQL